MYLSTVGALLLGATTVYAFRDASPFIVLSTSELLFTSPQIRRAASLSDEIESQLSKCPSNIYVLAHQPGITAADFSSEGATPYLKRWVAGNETEIRSSHTISNVIGHLGIKSLQETLENDCDAGTLHIDATNGLFDIVDNARPQVIRVEFPALPLTQNRRNALRENDLFLHGLLEMLRSSEFTVLYTTSPLGVGSSFVEESFNYEMNHDGQPLVHMELKRDLSLHKRQESNNATLVDGPLFERYQFTTPAIFMGGLVMIFLLSIAFVAVRAISGLEVTYAAFEKEMGKQQQQKQQ